MTTPESAIPACLGPQPQLEALTWQLPKGSWDTHFHVFGPTSRFPYVEKRKYTPPDSTYEDYCALMQRTGIERAVCVHPNVHGPDNSVTLDAIRRSEGRIIGIIKLDADPGLDRLRQLDADGIRGVRFAFHPQHGGEFDDALFQRVADYADVLGWCIDIHASPEDLLRLSPRLLDVPVPVIIDHMGRIDPSAGLAQEPFKGLLELAAAPNIWIKLTGADRLTRQGAPYDDVLPFARALVKAAPDRVLWGTDWPHSGYFDPAKMPNDGALVNFLGRVAPDEAARRAILVDNPNRLFAGKE